MGYQPDSDLHRIWVEELSRADCWILGFGYLRNGSSNTGLVAGSASPGLKIWEEEKQVMDSETQGGIYQYEELEG